MVYVGETRNMKKRMSYYKAPTGQKGIIYEEIIKYGLDNFRFEVEYFPNFTDEELLDM
jgi:hypothetical protein